MGRPKKLTVKIYSNQEIKKEQAVHPATTLSALIDKVDPEKLNLSSYYPLYLAVSYAGKNTKLRSPTFETINKNSIDKSLITSDPEKIRENDERVINCIKNHVESYYRREFNVNDINQINNHLYRTPIIELFSFIVRSFFSDLFENSPSDKEEFQYTRSLALNCNNMALFLFSINELNEEIISKFENKYPGWIRLGKYLQQLENENQFPFVIEIFDQECIFDKKIMSPVLKYVTVNQ